MAQERFERISEKDDPGNGQGEQFATEASKSISNIDESFVTTQETQQSYSQNIDPKPGLPTESLDSQVTVPLAIRIRHDDPSQQFRPVPPERSSPVQYAQSHSDEGHSRIVSDESEKDQEDRPSDPTCIGEREGFGQDTDPDQNSDRVEHLCLTDKYLLISLIALQVMKGSVDSRSAHSYSFRPRPASP